MKRTRIPKAGLPLLLLTCLASLLFGSFPASAEPTSAISDMNRAFIQLADEVTPAVVLINVVRGKARTYGSGFIISPDGLIMTNSHVIADANDIEVTVFGSQQGHAARLVGLDRDTDVGLIKLTENRMPFLKLGDSSKVRAGEIVFTVGNPLGVYSWSATFGMVSATGRTNVGLTQDTDMIQTNALMNPGNSGGPLVNIRGEVIGITTGNRRDASGISWVVPIDSAKLVMEELLKNGKVDRGYLGINGFQNLGRLEAIAYGLPNNKGVLVTSVMTRSPAHKAGIKRGDVILSYNEKIVEDSNHFKILVGEARPGNTVRLSIFRNGKVLGTNVTFD
ncbi:MAG TPA: trypsin-like peptidase domain-containing protein [Desulfomonilaceae bacterium]|nr:trypsin-like peptidase domain-containing protein [Desulfomonilaceae bacterium]